MHGDVRGVIRHEILEKIVRIIDHEMDVERKTCFALQTLHDHRAIGNVRYEMTVHHVNMNVVGTALLDLRNVCRKLRKIRRQYGWCKLFHFVSSSICSL